RPTVSGLTMAAALAVVAAIMSLTMFSISQREAKKAASKHASDLKDLNDDLIRTNESRTVALRRAAVVAAERGTSLCEGGNPYHGLLCLANALETLPDGNSEIEKSIRLKLDGWSRDIAPILFFRETPEAKCMPGIMAFSLDERQMLYGEFQEDRAEVQVVDVASGQPVGQLMKHDSSVELGGFLPDGRTVVTVTKDLRLFRWAFDNAELPAPSVVKLKGVEVVEEETPTLGQFLLTCLDREGVNGFKRYQVWETTTGRPIGEPFAHAVEKQSVDGAARPESNQGRLNPAISPD